MQKFLKTISGFTKPFRENLKALQEHKQWRYTPQFVMGLVIVITVTLIFPSSQSYQFANLKEGDVYSGEEIIAPFTFLVNKTVEEIANDRQSATEQVPLVFNHVDSIELKNVSRFDELFKEVNAVRNSDSADSTKLTALRNLVNNFSLIIDQVNIPILLHGAEISLSSNSNETIKKKFDSEFLRQNFRRILLDLYSQRVLNLGPENIPAYVKKISVISADKETLEDLENILTRRNYEKTILDNLTQTFPEPRPTTVKIGYQIITAFFRPNLIYNRMETEQRIEAAITNVPLSKGIVLENERIINPHERITRETLNKLNSLAAAKADREISEGGSKIILPYLGRMLLVSLSLSFAAMFLTVSRKEIFYDVKKMFLIFIIFMMVIGTTFLINQFGFSSNLKYLIPISIASMLLTIFFDPRVAFIGTVTLSIIIGGLRGNEFGMMIICLFVGTVSTFAVREIQARSWIIKGILSISIAYIISIAAIEFLQNTEFKDLWNMWLYGLINGLLSPILAYGLMIIFETIFRFTTNSTLLELSDLNKPLLRQLAIRAPGTYHHSIMVGNLSEAATEAIGGNALLARVASYYHDIGKMEKAEYFVENQKGGKNPHEKLTPSMSCLILINHVKRGLDLAHDYNLPKEIRDFIPEHHGTNIIRFFYEKAKESSDGVEINETDFRYPGPKPQTKETGIVMLADSVEAGSRSLKDPSVSRIRGMVNSFVHERLLDSELDECPLTTRDLNLIKESFVNTLTGMFHGRIEYPDQDKKPFGKGGKKPSGKPIEIPG